MTPNPKKIAEKINATLDELNLPVNTKERAALLSKMIDIPKPDAWALLMGQVIPNDEIIQKIVTELEIERSWLLD